VPNDWHWGDREKYCGALWDFAQWLSDDNIGEMGGIGQIGVRTEIASSARGVAATKGNRQQARCVTRRAEVSQLTPFVPDMWHPAWRRCSGVYDLSPLMRGRRSDLRSVIGFTTLRLVMPRKERHPAASLIQIRIAEVLFG